jgi:hypothetical protein
MVLSTAVPKLVGLHVPNAVQPLLDGGPASDVPVWAVHPGGRAILDRTQESLGLPDSAMESSRRVLREHGNMSSATVLFVLRDAVDAGLEDGSAVVALAFGPGLTVESARLTAVRTEASPAAEPAKSPAAEPAAEPAVAPDRVPVATTGAAECSTWGAAAATWPARWCGGRRATASTSRSSGSTRTNAPSPRHGGRPRPA